MTAEKLAPSWVTEISRVPAGICRLRLHASTNRAIPMASTHPRRSRTARFQITMAREMATIAATTPSARRCVPMTMSRKMPVTMPTMVVRLLRPEVARNTVARAMLTARFPEADGPTG